jgi:hypothetical protein
MLSLKSLSAIVLLAITFPHSSCVTGKGVKAHSAAMIARDDPQLEESHQLQIVVDNG